MGHQAAQFCIEMAHDTTSAWKIEKQLVSKCTYGMNSSSFLMKTLDKWQNECMHACTPHVVAKISSWLQFLELLKVKLSILHCSYGQGYHKCMQWRFIIYYKGYRISNNCETNYSIGRIMEGLSVILWSVPNHKINFFDAGSVEYAGLLHVVGNYLFWCV
jgi:hypothetical protein